MLGNVYSLFTNKYNLWLLYMYFSENDGDTSDSFLRMDI